MKWVFLAGLMVATVAMIGLLKQDRRRLVYAAFALGLLPFIEARFHVSGSPIAWPGWSGTVRGVEISVTDGLAFAMLLAAHKGKSPLVLRCALGLIIVAYIIPTVTNGVRWESLFFGWEIVRSLLVYLALLRATVTDERTPLYFLTGLIVGVVVQAGVVLQQYASGSVQAAGWFGHQNILGFVLHFILYAAFAAFLGGYYRKRMALAIVCSVIIAFTGASRATIGLTIVGMCLTTLFSIWHRASGRKAAAIGAALIGLLAVSPLLYSAIERRSVEQREGSNEGREKMQLAARMMMVDYPLGVGPNRYVLVANLGGYSDRAGVGWNLGNRAAPVHNGYYLVAAEMGLLGVAALLGLFIAGLATAIRALRAAPAGLYGEIAAGAAATILIVAVHSNFEWELMFHPIHNLLAMTLGIVSGTLVVVRRTANSGRRAPAHSVRFLPSPELAA